MRRAPNAGFSVGAVNFPTVVAKVLVPALVAPLVAAIAATAATYLAYTLTHRTRDDTRARGFRAGQVVTASLVSLAHGTNDAQKTMGVVTLTLITAGTLPAGSAPPLWVIISAGAAIALGTYAGGWRIVRTMGRGITDIQTPQGFAAEASATAVILTSSHVGFALSTTHVVSGGVIGAGLGRRLAEVRWDTAGRIVLAWLFTLPTAAVVGALSGRVAQTGTAGIVAVALVAATVAAAVYHNTTTPTITAVSCFLAAAALIGYGLYLVIATGWPSRARLVRDVTQV